MSKTMQYVYKGGIAVAALLASLMLLLPVLAAKSDLTALVAPSQNLFDLWNAENPSADELIMGICFSVVFFLGLILAVLAVLSIFVDNKIIDKILKIGAIVLAVMAIVGLICNFVVVGDEKTSLVYNIGAAGIVSAIFSVATAGLIWAEKALVK